MRERTEFQNLPLRFVQFVVFSVNAMFLTLFVYPRYTTHESFVCAACTAAVEVLAVMTVWSLWQAARTDAGTPPNTAQWKSEPDILLVHERDTKGEIRYNELAGLYYPDRSHYCSQEQRIVLKMDHYCPWVLAAIGFYNYKHFYLSVFYASLTSLTITAVLFGQLFVTENSRIQVTFLLATICCTGAFAVILTALWVFHTLLIAHNRTTLEFFKDRLSGSPYDLGSWSENFAMALGSNPHLWLFPVGQPVGDGLSFYRRSNHQLLSSSSKG